MSRSILILVNNEKKNEFNRVAAILSSSYRHILCADIVQALDLITTSSFDMVACDYTIKEINGLDFLMRVKQINSSISTMLLYSEPDAAVLIKCINSVAVDCVAALPVDEKELCDIVKSCFLRKSHMENLNKQLSVMERVNHENNRLYMLLKENMQHHDDNVLNVIISLANIIEAKDSYTDLHTRRVGSICRRLGRKMGLSDERVRALELSGFIHDIGKVGIPEGILNKPGRLTSEEFEKMKEHTIIGVNICKPLPCFEKCLDPLRHHHEKLDGSGYPDGLKGDEISLEARIVAVADIFDALYSKRPYRDKMPMDAVIRILYEEADAGCIDRLLVDVLIDMLLKGEIDDIITDKVITVNMKKGLNHEVYGAYKSKDYNENRRYLNILNNHVDGTQPPIVITGELGSGKTSLLAYWYQQYKKHNPDSFAIIHFSSVCDREAPAVLSRIMQEIKERYLLTDCIPTDFNEIINVFPLWLAKVQKEKLLLIIDSIDQVECSHYDWLPMHFPPNIRAVFTAVDVPDSQRFDLFGWQKIHIEPLSKAEREAIVEKHLGKYQSNLYYELNEHAEFEEKCSNPLFLRTVIEELKAYSNFKKLDSKLGYYLASADLNELYEKVLERLENDFGSSIINKMFSLLCISKNGLSIPELMSIGGFSNVVITGILSSIDYYIASTDDLLRLSNNYLKAAVSKRYLSERVRELYLHKKIAEYLERQIVTRKTAYDLPWHLKQGGLTDRLAASVSFIEVFNIYNQDNLLYELWSYWLFLGDKYDMVSAYVESLKHYLALAEKDENALNIITRLGLFFQSCGKYEAAIELFDKAYDISTSLGCSISTNTLMQKYKADSLLKIGNYKEAEKLYRVALNDREIFLGSQHPDTLGIYNDLILLLNYKGDYTASEKLIKYLLPIQQTIFGSEHYSIGKTLNSLGIIQSVKGDYDEAEVNFECAYTIYKNSLGAEHPETTRILNNLAAISVDKKDYLKAEKLYKQVLYIRQRLLGREHHYTAKCLNNLADVYIQMERYEEAYLLANEALKIYEKVFSQDHPDIATVQTTMAEILLRQSKHPEAEVWCLKSISVKKSIFGIENIKLANSIKLLAEIQAGLGKLAEAKSSYRDALSIYEKLLGGEHFEAIACSEAISAINGLE